MHYSMSQDTGKKSSRCSVLAIAIRVDQSNSAAKQFPVEASNAKLRSDQRGSEENT